MPRGRGGARQGTPGKAYTNRTDLGVNYDNSKGSAAAGGAQPKPQPDARPVMPVYPEDTPSLMAPTNRPNEPIAEGLPIGPGRGREALTNYDPRPAETQQLKRWLPLLEPFGNDPATPESVRTLIQYIRGA